MPRDVTPPVPRPIFQEPVFNEAVVSGDPAGFQEPHPSDNEVYKQIENLLGKDVVSFEKSRVAPGEIFKLEDALGPRGSDIVGQIRGIGRIVFHALGDSGASNSQKYGSEINIADQLTTDAHTADPSDRPGWSFANKVGDIWNSDESTLGKVWDTANTPLVDLHRDGATGIESGLENLASGLTSPLSMNGVPSWSMETKQPASDLCSASKPTNAASLSSTSSSC